MLATQTPQKFGAELICSGKVDSSWFTGGTR